MTDIACVCCGRPTPDGYACHEDAQDLADTLLRAGGHAEDAATVIARQARYGAGPRTGSADLLPVDLAASAKLAAVANTVGGWVRVLLEETGAEPSPPWHPAVGPLCAPWRPGDEPRRGNRCDHTSCAAIRDRTPPSALAEACMWLAGQTGRLRVHPAAGEAFRDLRSAASQLARLIDRPPDKQLVGMCDCGKVLYAEHGRGAVRCPEKTCQLTWNVDESRDILRRALDGKLVAAAEAAWLAAFLDTGRTQEQIRKLINKWAERALIEAHGHVVEDDGVDEDGVPRTRTVPAYRFGDVVNRLARTPKRAARERDAA